MRRRQFIKSVGAAVVGASVLAACRTSGTTSPNTGVADVEGADLVAKLLEDEPFFIAHRGSGDDYPEHTMTAYESVVADGAAAIEVSVVITASGVLVCGHDLTIDRVTGSTGAYGELEFDELGSAPVDMSDWLGPGWDPVPHTPLREVLDRFLGEVVIFLEPKAVAAHAPMMDMLERYPEPQRSVVYKAYKWGEHQTGAKSRGYRVWSYVDEDTPVSEVEGIVSDGADMIGLPHRDDISAFPHTPDEAIEEVVALGKPVICWEVHRRWAVEHLSSLGVRGMMSSGWNHVTRSVAPLSRDSFATGRRPPGDLPRTHVPSEQPTWDGDELVLDAQLAGGYLVGSLSREDPPDSYTIQFDVAFDTVPTDGDAHSGIVLARTDDSAFAIFQPQRVGGYHLVLRADGRVQLYRHDPDRRDWVSRQLASAHDDQPQDGEFRRYEIAVSPGALTVQRINGTPSVLISSTDTTYRGGYLHLARNWDADRGPVRYRDVTVS